MSQRTLPMSPTRAAVIIALLALEAIVAAGGGIVAFLSASHADHLVVPFATVAAAALLTMLLAVEASRR